MNVNCGENLNEKKGNKQNYFQTRINSGFFIAKN